MEFKSILKRVARSLPATHVLRYFPRGLDAFIDLKVALPNYQVQTLFDVGANIGQSAKDYHSMFPSARIFSFEPVTETYCQLVNNCRKSDQINCFKLALSSFSGEGEILAKETSTANHLIDKEENLNPENKPPIEQVDILTLDKFCESEEVEQISYLKIDTEGEDFKVLKGSARMLQEQRIDLVEVEAGMHPNNKYHVPFEVLKEYLEEHNYLLFGIYVQTQEFFEQKPHLRRANPLFISNRLIDAHDVSKGKLPSN